MSKKGKQARAEDAVYHHNCDQVSPGQGKGCSCKDWRKLLLALKQITLGSTLPAIIDAKIQAIGQISLRAKGNFWEGLE